MGPLIFPCEGRCIYTKEMQVFGGNSILPNPLYSAHPPLPFMLLDLAWSL